MKKLIPYLILLACAITTAYTFFSMRTSGINYTAMLQAQADSITRLSDTADSLRVLDAMHAHRDSVLADQQQTVIVRTIYRVDSTRHLPPTGAVDMFNEHTGRGARLNADSTVTSPLQNIIEADVLFIEYDASLELNRILTDRNNEMKVRIGVLLQMDTTNRQTISVLTNRNNTLTADNKQKDRTIKEGAKAIRREKVLRVVTIAGSVVFEVVTIVLLL